MKWVALDGDFMDRFDEVVNELGEFFKLCDGCEHFLNLFTDLVTLSDIDNRSGVYAIYLRDEGGCRLLYIGETSSLLRRFVELVSFNHTFSWRLFIRLLEVELGRSVKNSEALKLWEDRSLRRKIVKKMENFFKKTCVKWKTLEGINVNERRQIEKELINKLKPLMPHKKNRKSIFKDIFKGGP